MALHIFRLKDMTLQKMIAAHERAISAICWSPVDTNLLASCSISGKVAIWDLESEEERFVSKVDSAPQLMDWAPVGDKIALALETGEVRLWEFRDAGKQSKLFVVAQNGAKVLRWHPRGGTRLLVGDNVGSLHVYDQQTGKKVQIVGKSKTTKDPVTDAQWDPLSEEYLLVAFQDGTLTLYEANTQREVHSFDKQPQSIKSLAWARAQPGNFVTATDRVGVLRLWNVSQRAPLAQIKVGPAGVNCIKAIPNYPNWFVLSFKNSAVGVCDIATRTIKFMSTPGHSETIFDVVFHPEDPDMLATASYDGHVKFWRISTMESHRDMFAGKDQLLYGLALGPGASRVCAVSSTGFLFIWRTDTGEQMLSLQLHSGQAYRCEWNHKGRAEGTGEIVTGGADGTACVVDAATGSILYRLTHPGPVIGVAWHATQNGILATACQDGAVRIFNLLEAAGGTEPKPQTLLQGHEARVFNIAFHPICHSIIASGSDDKTIRVWQWISTGPRELRKLVGHTAYVRGLLWHSELPDILFSGSWDATIRVWDVVAQRCLHVVYEHHADVYGLALHPRRPFFLASSSRDTTLRFWIFEDEVRPLLVQALVRPARFAELLGAGPEEAEALLLAAPGSVPMPPRRLYGQESRALASALANLCQNNPGSLQVYQKIVSFFLYRAGMEDLWGLLGMARGEPQAGIAASSRTVFHEQEMIQCQKSKALELASQRVSFGVIGKYEERLLKAAQIMLRVGDLRSYCRFTAQAGQWERAICIAPAVSQEFWSELCSEYMDTLSATTDLEEAAPFWVATGRSSRLVDTCIERGELDNAFVVATAESAGLMPGAAAGTGAAAAPAAAGTRSRLEDVAAVLASRYAELGEPLQAAMVFLAVSNIPRAVSALSRASEVVLAYVVADLLGQPKDPVALKLLAQCAERDGRWDVAAELWQNHPQGQAVHLPLLAARCPNKDAAAAWSPWGPEQFKAQLASAQGAGAVLAAVCAGEPERAAQAGVEGLHALFASGNWSVAQAREFLDPLEALPLQDMKVKDIAGVLSCAAYVGLVEASQQGYHDLIFPLAQTLRNIVTHQNLQFPVSAAEITLLEVSCVGHRNPSHALAQLSQLLASPDLPQHLRQACETQVGIIQQRPVDDADSSSGLAKLAGGHLPTCYKRYAKTSVLTNALIRGPAFSLEDQKSFISLSDALAWARVNIFSPLNTGCKIYPV